MNFDVVIVGAGTAGAYLAYLLGKSGFNVCLIEAKRIEKLFKITGDAIGEYHIKREGLELPNEIIDNVYKGAELYSPSTECKLYLPGKGYSLNMWKWSKWLIQKCINVNVTVLDGHIAIKPLVNGSKVIGVKIRDSINNVDKEVYGKIIVDASGATAVLRTKLPKEWPISEPIKPEDVSYAYREIIEIDSEIEYPERIRIYLNLDIAPGGYWWFFPKGEHCVNLGLGIWGKLVVEKGYNPVDFYRKKLMKGVLKLNVRKILDSGGGIVPTRRPLYTMVHNNFLAVGDAAVTVNPVHGGGLGPSMLSSRIASSVIIEAFEKGDYSMKTLWKYNIEYLKAYGIKQAKLDIFRIMLQTLTNEEIELGLKSRILSETDILNISGSGETLPIWTKLKILVKVLKIPKLAKKLILATHYMKRIEKIYLNYPKNPEKITSWINQLNNIYKEYFSKLEKLK